MISYTSKHMVVSWGYRRTSMSNKSCGISIFLLKKWFRRSHIVRTVGPGDVLSGRGGAITLRSPAFHLKVLGGYFPPRPADRKALSGWKQTCNELLRWHRQEIEREPSRCFILNALDLNDRLGGVRVGADSSVGGVCSGVEG